MIPVYQEQQPLTATAAYLPAVSLIMPFQPVLSAKKDLEHDLTRALEQVERKLMAQFPRDRAIPVLERLRKMIRALNYNTHKKSVAIFASLVVEKVYYLDVAVDQRIVVDGSFGIRDIVHARQRPIKYLLMLLSAERSKIFLGNGESYMLIKANGQEHVHGYERDLPEKVANFSDLSAYKEILLDKFLHHMDQGLAHILKAYPYPVFVMGTEKVMGHFRRQTHHAWHIVGYVHGNFIDAAVEELREAMHPYLNKWETIRQEALMARLRAAADDNKLCVGIRQTWKAASGRNATMLVLEKGFVHPGKVAPETGAITGDRAHEADPFYIRDAVDTVIERVLVGGGEVEFVEDGVLSDYGHIALIRYY